MDTRNGIDISKTSQVDIQVTKEQRDTLLELAGKLDSDSGKVLYKLIVGYVPQDEEFHGQVILRDVDEGEAGDRLGSFSLREVLGLEVEPSEEVDNTEEGDEVVEEEDSA